MPRAGRLRPPAKCDAAGTLVPAAWCVFDETA